jgi:hypothetical protein
MKPKHLAGVDVEIPDGYYQLAVGAETLEGDLKFMQQLNGPGAYLPVLTRVEPMVRDCDFVIRKLNG